MCKPMVTLWTLCRFTLIKDLALKTAKIYFPSKEICQIASIKKVLRNIKVSNRISQGIHYT